MFGVRYFPKGIFPRDNIPSGNSQLCNFPNGNLPKVRYWGRALRLGWARGSSAASRKGWGTIATARTNLGNYTFGMLPLGKNPLGKYLRSNLCMEGHLKLHLQSL